MPSSEVTLFDRTFIVAEGTSSSGNTYTLTFAQAEDAYSFSGEAAFEGKLPLVDAYEAALDAYCLDTEEERTVAAAYPFLYSYHLYGYENYADACWRILFVTGDTPADTVCVLVDATTGSIVR